MDSLDSKEREEYRKLRALIREEILLEIPEFIFHDSEQGPKQAQMTADAWDGTPVIESFIDIATAAIGAWNKTLGAVTVKVPGFPGAENYKFSDMLLDVLLVVYGGKIAGAALGKIASMSKKGKDLEKGLSAAYAIASSAVSPGVTRKVVQFSMKTAGNQPTDNTIKFAYQKISDAFKSHSPGDKIEIEVDKEDFEKAVKQVLDSGGKLLKDQDFPNFVEFGDNVYKNLGFEV
jgi:hypothetical protein